MSAQKVGVVDEAALQRVAASTAKERMYAWHVLSSHVILHCSSNPSLLSLSVRLRRDELSFFMTFPRCGSQSMV
jgi:hypothetical protein